MIKFSNTLEIDARNTRNALKIKKGISGVSGSIFITEKKSLIIPILL